MKRYIQSGFKRINKLILNKKRKLYRKKYPEFVDIFNKYVKTFHKSGGFSYPTQDLKVFDLLELLIEKKPKNFVEYGTGSTSLACAYYATNYDAQYLGLDESEKWAKLNMERIKAFIPNIANSEIKHFPRIDEYSEKIYHTNLNFYPDHYFDFMLIDGPSFDLNEEHIFPANNDIIKYKTLGIPETIIVDNRKCTVHWLKEYLKDSHRCTNSSMWTLDKKIVNTNTAQYFSVFEKT